MGGSGKTVIASALLRDKEIRHVFQRLAFVAIGQTPDLLQIQLSVYLQLTGQPLDMSSTDGDAVLNALQNVAKGMNILLCIDDAWDVGHVRALNCLDPVTASCTLVTTRIQRFLPVAPEVSVGLLEPDDAIALMLEVAGVPAKPPFDRLAYEVADACGRLPLVLSVAGSMLEQYGGMITDRFLNLLREDNGEALRQGDFGDKHVLVEDRIISASLKSYQGHDQEQVEALLYHFAIFPEDARVPVGVFDTFASSVFGASGKRGDMKVRAWLSTLLRLSLLQGSLADGVHQP